MDRAITLATLLLAIAFVYLDGTLVAQMWPLARDAYLELIASVQHTQYIPVVVTLVFIAFVFLFKHPIPRWLRCCVVSYTFLLHTLYILFRIGTLNCRDPFSTFASISLLATELIHYLMMCCLYLQMGWPVNKSSQADRCERLVKEAAYQPRVAIFVPTYNEPVSLLRRTLTGCLNIDYPHKAVYLLDDQDRSEMNALAAELGCKYISRTDNKHAKAGNLNNALAQADEDLIAFFDCDNVPSANFLSRLIGFFHDPRTAMVISSLHYYNAQEKTREVGIEMLIAADHAKALSNSQCGRDTFNALLCFGTSYIVRRQTLLEIGGIPTDTLCEDWATSIKLQALGYRTHFVNEVLSSGVAAENLSEFIQQRLRWCRGTLQSLFVATNPLSIRGFNWVQRLVHFHGVLYYLMFPATLLSFSVPLLYFFFGIVPIEADAAQFACFFLPYLLMHNAMYVCFSRRLSSLISSQVGDFILCFPLTLVVAQTFCKPFGKGFRVTLKEFTSDKAMPVPWGGYPMLILFTLYAAAIIVGAGQTFWYGVDAPFVVYSLWSIYRMVFFWLAFQAAVDLPQRRHAVRFQRAFTLSVSSRDGVRLAEVPGIDISDTGLSMQADATWLPRDIVIGIPAVKLEHVSARVVRADAKGHLGLEFVELTTEQRRIITQFIYCRPGEWEGHSMPERTAFIALIKKFAAR